MKRNHKPDGVLIFEPELTETIRRIKNADPDLREIIERTEANGKADACNSQGDAGNSDPTTMNLIASGTTEDEALKAILPHDKNRKRKLDTWTRLGLWPLDQTDSGNDSEDSATDDGLHDADAIEPPATASHTYNIAPELEAAIRQIVRDELEKRHRLPESNSTRPLFNRHNPKTRSVRLGADLLEAAEVAARRDRDISGGNFNGLIEYLLWKFLNFDSRFIIED